ncbi:MAG TPA: hypothetical protein VMW41_01155 [Candidatus Bathyarchaeia archaeon]|nr:hypothetical protein [Candidatus Bathyarchaeia archaeon]
MLKISRRLNKKALILSLILDGFLILFASQCLSLGFVLDCYGPGCNRQWCDHWAFLLFDFYLVIYILLTVMFIELPGGELLGLLVCLVIILPANYLVSLLIIKLVNLTFSRFRLLLAKRGDKLRKLLPKK